MKHGMNIRILIVIFFFSFAVSYAGLENSHHDFSGADWANYEYCLPCHAPHNANTEVPQSPLWNHQLSTATYQVYASPTYNAAGGQPSGTSKLCLSCHDGTVAIENHSGSTSGTWYASTGNVGTALTDDHPISFTYDQALATLDGALYDPTSTPSGLGGTIQEDLLSNNMVQCTSCHDPHISRNTQGCLGCHTGHGSYKQSLSLVKSNDQSALCLTCHKK